MSAKSQAVRAAITQLLAKALVSIGKLIKTKLMPKVMERYCKNLHKFTEKLSAKTTTMIDSIVSIKDTKKLIATLYILRLVEETTNSVGEALKTLSKHIATDVDFSAIDNPKTDEAATAVAEIELLANAADGECGEDGCEIA